MAKNKNAQENPNELSEGRVLVVDDNADIITLTKRILERHNYDVLTANNGISALEIVRRELPDIVLLDVMMPELDGLEVCRRLKDDPETRKIMVLLITGRGSVDHRVEGLEAGADDYITKPFHLMELLARVRSALRIKRLTEEIEELNQRLLEAQKERLQAEKMATIGLLATGIAHEFNNIMSGMSGFAQLAKSDDSFKDHLVKVTLTQCERATRITNSLSTFYKPSFVKKPVSVQNTLEDALYLVAKDVKQKEVEVVRNFLDDDPHVLAQEAELQEVFLNMLINALHALGAGGTLTLTTEREPKCVRVLISDNGCGISAEVMDHIFDPFFTTKGALGGGGASGSGLGLSLSYNIVNSHQGRIEVESELGKGTTFTITLPAVETGSALTETRIESDAVPRPGVSTGSPPGNADDPAILIGDADVSVQEMVQRYLEGWKIVVCNSWEEVDSELEKNSFSVAVLDTELPGEGNFEERFLALSHERPDLRLILTSQHFSLATLKSCLDTAFNHLLKPYAVENLASVLSSDVKIGSF